MTGEPQALTAQAIIDLYDGPSSPLTVWATASHHDVERLADTMIGQVGEEQPVAEDARTELVTILTERRRLQREEHAREAAEAERTAWMTVDVDGELVYTRRSWPDMPRTTAGGE